MKNLAVARNLLKEKVEIVQTTGFYECQPYGYHKQPWFINQCLKVRTKLSPRELLNFCKGVEWTIGRYKGRRWGPRLVDIDILLFGDKVVNEEDLIIPHKEFARRRFVLIPYAEIDMERAVRLLSDCNDLSIVIPL